MKPTAEKKSATPQVANSKKTMSVQQRKLKKKNTSSSTENKSNGAEPALYANHPLAPLFGKYNNDPVWKDIEEAIRRNREQDIKDIKNFKE